MTQPSQGTGILLSGRPLAFRFQGHEKLGIVKTVRVGAVIRPADLSHDGFDLGELSNDRSGDLHFVGDFVHGNVERERAPNPEVALLQLRHEFPTEQRPLAVANANLMQHPGGAIGLS